MKKGSRFVKIVGWITGLVIVGACVDPIAFDSQAPAGIIILDGSITTDEGPYTITMTSGLALDLDSTASAPVTGASIVLHSDKDQDEPFVESKPGVYQTGGVIKGTIGNTYYISMTMPDGATFESQPETIMPSGHVEKINYRFEARTVEKSFGKVPADVFNVFVDATAPASETGKTSFVRWRFTGSYVVETHPELHVRWLQGMSYFLDPFPCSGWVVDPALGGGKLRQAEECQCCRCWITQHEPSPKLSDNELVEGGQYRNLKVGEVPISRRTFFEKYKVTVDQMTISQNAFDFLKVIRAQKDGSSNLFQPPPGKIVGNIKAVNATYQIVGLFWGASINTESIYISKTDLPYILAQDVVTFPCTYYGNSTNVKPADWDE